MILFGKGKGRTKRIDHFVNKMSSLIKEYKLIKISNISSKVWVRGMDEESEEFHSLKNSIKHSGLIEPILVRPSEKKENYEIVAGHRRFAAAIHVLKDEDKIPCIVTKGKISDVDALTLDVEHTLHHKGLSMKNMITALELYETNGFKKTKDIANILDVSESFVSQIKKVRENPELMKKIERGEIKTFGEARGHVYHNPSHKSFTAAYEDETCPSCHASLLIKIVNGKISVEKT